MIYQTIRPILVNGLVTVALKTNDLASSDECPTHPGRPTPDVAAEMTAYLRKHCRQTVSTEITVRRH